MLAAASPARRARGRPDLDALAPETMDDASACPWRGRGRRAPALRFALVALLLAAMGLYGALASVVGERTRELGIASALGAAPARLRREVLGRHLAVCRRGVVAGVVPARSPGRGCCAAALRGEPDRPGGALGVRAARGGRAVAAYVPARRATRIAPWRRCAR